MMASPESPSADGYGTFAHGNTVLNKMPLRGKRTTLESGAPGGGLS